MDAYSTYIMQLSEARLGDLRRAAAEYRLSQAARAGRSSLFRRFRARLPQGGTAVRAPATSPPYPLAGADAGAEAELRRSA